MTLDVLLESAFGKNAIAERPSFKSSEVDLVQQGVRLTLKPRSESVFMGLPRLIAADFTQGARSLRQGNYAALISIDGFYVGGMARDLCTCGVVPVWVGQNQQSAEPGRRVSILEALGYKTNPPIIQGQVFGIASKSDVVDRLVWTGLGYLGTVHEEGKVGSAYLPHRIFQVGMIAYPADAKRYTSNFKNAFFPRDERGVLVAPYKKQDRGIQLSISPMNGSVYVELAGIYLDMMPRKENAQVKETVSRVFA